MSAARRSAPTELRATYRLQLTSSFGFASARALVPYLRDLGISHLYLSPSLQARAGSTHGYDVVDPSRVSDALGGTDGLEALADSAHAAGLGIVLDLVPNHMAADDANPFWADPALREKFFDIDAATGRHRRFFDVDDLAGVRQEDPGVFEATHELALSLVARGLVDGLRIDHPDGLADPLGYLERLRSRGVERVWVEKILSGAHPPEHLRDWPVCGTVGYEFLNDVCALFVDQSGEDTLTALWASVSGNPRPFGEVAFEAKLEQASGTFAPEVERLARELGAGGLGSADLVVSSGPGKRDANDGDSVTTGGTKSPSFVEALTGALSSLPIYRTYVDPLARRVDQADRRALAGLDPAIASMLLLESPAPPAFVTRFQQTTPAIMAKGVEDTAFYRYGRLLALNDVGGDPSRFGIDVERFHAGCLERAQRFPANLLTTMTHDAKRSADVRARIGAIASLPEDWTRGVERWFAFSEALGEDGAPDDIERYFLLQTLAGTWPIAIDRIESYMVKALREAKRNTNWIRPKIEYEEAVTRYCHALVRDPAFLADFEPFVARLAEIGDRAALCQVVLKLTTPGIPDIYQGDELPYRALVDPDNRRGVDWPWREAMLRRLMGGAQPATGTRKLFAIMRLLGLRARRPAPFFAGYEPLDAGAEGCAFLRGGEVVVVVALRAGADVRLSDPPRGRWREVLSGDQLTLAAGQSLRRLLGVYGLAVLERL